MFSNSELNFMMPDTRNFNPCESPKHDAVVE
jgi:hypothetical protein